MSKANFIISLFLFAFSAEILCQEAYASYQPDQIFNAFSEDFDNNANQWFTDNLWISSKVNFGYYNIKCNNYQQAIGLSYKKLPVNQSKDYEIESSIKVIEGIGALVFGLTSKFDHYRIEMSDKNKLIFLKDTPSRKKIERLFSDSNNPNLKKDTYNKVTIRKISNTYYIFINEVLIKQFNNIMIEGDQVGFSVGLDSEISIDYLKISYLKSGESPLFAEQIFLNNYSASQPGDNTLSNGSGPSITWVSPSGQTTPLQTYTARIKANVRSNSGLKSVLVYLNGVSKGESEIKTVYGEEGNFLVEKIINFEPGSNNIYFVATNNEGTTKSELRYFVNPESIPPVVSWEKPIFPSSIVKTGNFVLEICIKSPTELKSAKIIVNGDPQFEDNVFQLSTGDGDCNYVWKRPVILKEGDNDIFIIATNAAGSTTSEKRTIKVQPSLTDRRLALVIGNSEYGSKSNLKNPVNDANLMEASLKELGFDVIKSLNAGISEMKDKIRQFSQNLSEYNVALFYYAGHGIQVDGVNYLLPIDAILKEKADCKFEAVRVDFVVEEFEKYPDNTNIVILDACRNNPFASWDRGGENGFKAIIFTSGTIISFATSEGATAADGDGDNGLFTEELIKQMAIPQPVESVFKKTRIEVKNRTNGKQVPQEWSKLTGDFYFKK